jgi:hypothetical protein
MWTHKLTSYVNQCGKGGCGRVTDIEMRLTQRTLVVIHLVP